MQRRLSPAGYRRITALALTALVFIIFTGAAVRLTGSGLGCADWPTCERNRLVAPLEYHAMVEWVNRLITGVVSVAVILAVLGSLLRNPRRPDLTRLALGLVGWVIAQVLLGGLVVLLHLSPPLVMGHFVLSLAAVANATVLHHRAGLPDTFADRRVVTEPRVAPEVRTVSRWLLVGASLVVLTGTVVTGTGPHGGDPDVERLPFDISDVARIHAVGVWLFVLAVLSTLWLLRRTGAPSDLFRHGYALLAVVVAQGAIGYSQYGLGVPVGLVALHVLGAVAVWWTTLRLYLQLAGPRDASARVAEPRTPARIPA